MSETLEQSDLEKDCKEIQLGPKTVRIPHDWDVISLGNEEYAERTMGGTPDTDVNEYWGGNIPWMRSGELHKKHIKDVEERISQEGKENSRAELIPEHSILVGLNGQGKTKGTVAVNEIELTTNQSVGAYLLNHEKLDHRYVFYSLESQYEVFRALAGGGRSGLNLQLLGQMKVPYPPISEQCRIADILSTVDDQIQQTDEIVTKTGELQRGVLNEVIPRGLNKQNKLRPSPEEDAELYEEVRRCTIPQQWEVSPLQDLCDEDVTYGIVQAGPHVEDGVPYIKTGDMTNDELKIEELSRTAEEIAEDYSRSKVLAGELVMTIRATVGVVKQIPPELAGANLTQGTARISPKDSIDNRYLLWAIRSNLVQSLIEARTKGSTFNEITLGALRKVPIPHPVNLDEQQRIAERIDAVADKLQAEKSYLKKIKELKRGLMQDLLTGKVRVDPHN